MGLTLIAAAFFATRLPANELPPSYEVGDLARADVTTPVPLMVIDLERTEKLRQQEAQKQPATFRFHAEAADEVEAAFRSAFAVTRAKFQSATQTNFNRRVLTAPMLASAKFQRLVGSFQKQNKSFPLSANLAQLWAKGEDDELLQSEWAILLRSFMGRFLRAEALPADAKVGPAQVRMIPINPAAGPRATSVNRTNIFPLSKARQELTKNFPPDQQAAAKYLTAFLKENCRFDPELTRQSRAPGAGPVWAAARFEPGETIIRAGQIIDPGLKSALDQLREKLLVERARAEAAEAQRQSQAVVARLHEQAERERMKTHAARTRNRWLLAGLTVLALVFLIERFRFARRKRSLLPARLLHGEADGSVISCPSCAEVVVIPRTGPAFAVTSDVSLPDDAPTWKERALAAERRAEHATALVRAGLLPQFARWFKDKLLCGLLAQRAQLLDTQQIAAAELDELERRLAKIHAPLAGQLKDYERRIAELEKELAVKGELNRELIRAKIAVARKQLEARQAERGQVWN